MGAVLCEEVGDDAAHGVSDEIDGVELERVEELEHICSHELEGVTPGPVTPPVPTEIEGVDAPGPGEGGQDDVPVGGVFA